MPVPVEKKFTIFVHVPRTTIENVREFKVSCVILKGGRGLGTPACVDRIRKRRSDLLAALSNLKKVLQRDAGNQHTTADIVRDIQSLLIPKNKDDSDVANANEMA